MAEFRAAYRYALSLLEVVEETRQIDVVTRDFEFLDGLIRGSRDFLIFLHSPIVSKLKKKETLKMLLTGKVNEIVLRFIFLLVAKGRENLLPEIIQEFYKLRDERMGVINVRASTSVQLSEQQQRILIQRIEQSTKKKVRMKTAVDPSLKGGFRIQYNDTVWDASVKHQLELLRQRLLQGESL